MRRWKKRQIPTLAIVALAFVSFGFVPKAVATVILTTDRSLFLSSNSIVSTEAFDEFPHPTQFPLSDHSVTIYLVTYCDHSPSRAGGGIEFSCQKAELSFKKGVLKR